MADSVLVLPTEIPWANLKSRDLEETVYWLLDALGAKDLEWRRGGDGAGAADQGRDLEATFQAETPDGSFDAKRWWVEAKGRSRSVERRAVQNAMADAEARSEVDVLVVVTNVTFTNPVRDHVAQWNAMRKRPMVKLWDRDTLEKMLSRQPSVVARLFADALSPQGQLEAASERFWRRTEFASDGVLAKLWENRKSLEYKDSTVIALLASEYANGSPAVRRWTEEFVAEEVFSLFGLGLRNLAYLLHRASAAGNAQTPVVRAVGHALVVALREAGAEPALRVVDEYMRYPDGKPWNRAQVDEILLWVCGQMTTDFLWPCAKECDRVLTDGPEHSVPPKEYWQRFRERVRAEDDADARSDRTLIVYRHDKPCRVGFPANKMKPCPLVDEPTDVREAFRILEHVVKARLAMSQG